MKRLYKLLALVLFFTGLNGMNLCAQQITVSSRTGCLNDTAYIALTGSNINKLAAMTLNISFDTTVMRFVGHGNLNTQITDFLSGVPASGPNAGKLVISMIDNTLQGINLSNTKICDLKFIYKGGSSTISILSTSELVDTGMIVINTSFTAGNLTPTILSQPSSTQTCEGSNATFTTTAVSGSLFQWQIFSGGNWSNLNNGTSYSGVTTATLQVISTPISLNTKAYRCKVTKTCDAYTNQAVLTVNPKPIAVANNDTTICQGNSITVTSAGSSGGTGTLTYSWNQGLGIGISFLITPATTTKYTLTATDTKSCSSTDSILVTVTPLPSAAGTISGTSPVCQGQSAVNYTVPTITNATSYVWTLPTNASGTSSTSSITINFGISAVNGNITVKGQNSCGFGTISSKPITVNPLPTVAGTISGPATVCQGDSLKIYTVPTIANATSYIWTLPSGATGASTTNSITTKYSISATSGSITVKGNNSCGNGTSSTLAITVNPYPVAAGTISGATTVCQGQTNVTYSVPVITNATSYVWTLPTGATGTSSTNSITVNYGTTAISGSITVKGSNSCGYGTSSSLAITLNPLPNVAGTVSGLTTVCQGQSGVSYSVPTISNANSYIWTLPNGASGTSTTNNITVNYSNTAPSGNITVKGQNSCGLGTASTLAITVNPLPETAGNISGNATVCQGQNNVTYSTPTIANAITYTWTLPTGATGTSSINSITVNYNNTASSGNITVKGQNTCGSGISKSMAITVNPYPVAAGTISGATTVCQGQTNVTYSVPVITNATSYVWTLPTGATGTSSTNSITVNYGTTAISGSITVKGSNSCGYGTSSSLAITLNPLPNVAGTISGLTAVCQGQSGVSYSVPAISNANSYIWTLPNGASGTSTTNNITVNYSNTAPSGNITVKGQNSCGLGTASTLAITVNPLPETAGNISGNATVCQGQNNVTYSTPTIANATTYTWTLPTGATGTSSTNTITVNYNNTASSGNITVKGQNTCGSGVSKSMAITVNPLPVAAGSISGITTVCQRQTNVTYSVPVITNATSYVWTLPTGATGTSSTNSITVNYGISAISGNITVKGQNSCGMGTASTLTIIVNPLPSPSGNITGNITVCQGQNNVAYSIPTITNATTYIWTLPNGATGSSLTNTITVNYSSSASSGIIMVKGQNSCGIRDTAQLAITVNQLPGIAGSITGPLKVCKGSDSITYSVSNIANALTYQWTYPAGFSGNSISNTLKLAVSSNASSGNITVKGVNSCGQSNTSSLTLNTFTPPIANSGNDTAVCRGNTVVISAALSSGSTPLVYNWSNLGTNISYTVNPVSSQSYLLTVTDTNGCSSKDSLSLTIYQLPVAFAGNDTSICAGDSILIKATGSTGYPVLTYNWNNGLGNTDSVKVSPAATTSYILTVADGHSCSDKDTIQIMVSFKPLSAGIIAGDTAHCKDSVLVQYSIPVILHATSYNWTFPQGVTQVGNGNAINLSFPANSVSGNLVVRGVNQCGSGDSSYIHLSLYNVPPTPVIVQNTVTLTSSAPIGNQWYEQGIGTISGATSQSYVPVMNGSYYVIVKIGMCSSDTSNIIKITDFGLDEMEISHLEIIPNPSQTETSIYYTLKNSELVRISLFEFTGKEIKNILSEMQSSGKQQVKINVESLPNGIYFCKFKTEKGIICKKLIVNK